MTANPAAETHRRRAKISWFQVLICLFLIAMALVCVYPMWYTLIISISDKAKAMAGEVYILPKGFNLIAYRKLLSDTTFFDAFFVSVKRVVLGCALNMALMLLTAYPLAMPENRFPRKKYYVWFLVFNMLFYGGMIPAFINIKNLGLYNTIWSLVLPGALPIYNTFLLMNFFKNVPYDMNESTTVDGASALRILFQIYVPVSLPALATVLLFCFVGHWNSWFDGLIYINQPQNQPLQTLIYQLNVRINAQSMTSEEIRELSVLSSETVNAAKIIIALIPIMAIYPFIQRYFVMGLTLGAVKE